MLRAATLSIVLSLAPFQCAHKPDPDMRREDTPGDALWGLAENFRAQHNEVAERQTLAYLVEKYPSSRYADVAKLQIDLNFAGMSRPPPSPQSHSYYPPARAFFRFACPCSECDGEFDLSASVASLAEMKQPSARTASGRLGCEGMHFRERATAAPCPMVLSWRLVLVRAD